MAYAPTQKTKWIETGYRHFIEYGPKELKITNIAHDAGVSRTTFYHFFTDLDDFIDHLLGHHRELAKVFHAELKKAKTYTDLFKIMASEPYLTGILFHRQLLLHKDNPYFYQTYQALNKIGNEIVFPLWAVYYGYEGNSLVGKKIHLMLLDIWYLNIQKSDFNQEAFLENSNNIRRQFKAFAGSHYLQNLVK